MHALQLRARSRLTIWLVVLMAFGANVAAAQSAAADTTHLTREPLFDKMDVFIALGFAGATVALFPADKRIAQHLEEPANQENRFIHHAATGTELITNPGAYVIGAGLYAFGRLAHVPRAAELGLHGTEAVLVGSAVTGLLKGLAGRSRPFVTSDSNPHDFHFGRGFTHAEDTSFPSGHATAAFAAAAAVTDETHTWWPNSVWVIAPLMYGGAASVGLSRMYHNKHWASDVILGAGIGTFSGLKVVRFNHTHQGNRIDRWLLATEIAPDGHGGGVLAWSVPLR